MPSKLLQKKLYGALKKLLTPFMRTESTEIDWIYQTVHSGLKGGKV